MKRVFLLALLFILAACGAIYADAGKVHFFPDSDGPLITMPLLRDLKYYDANGNALGSLVLTRTSTGTYIDSDGLYHTAAVATPRFGYTDFTASNFGGLLLEAASTNYALWSEQLDNAKWRKSNVTVTANKLAPPVFGNTTGADILSPAAVGGTIFQVYTTTSPLSAGMWDYSMALKALSGTPKVTISLRRTRGGYSNYTATLSTAWKRVNMYRNVTGTFRTMEGRITFTHSTSTVYASCGQIERSPCASSYIPTGGAIVVRNADSATFPRPAAYDSAGTFLMNFTPRVGDGPLAAAAGIFGPGASAFRLYQSGGAVARVLTFFDGTNTTSAAGTGSALTTYRIAGKWSATRGQMSCYQNGVKIGPGTYRGTFPTDPNLYFLYLNYGWVKNFSLFNTMLSDADIGIDNKRSRP